MQIHHNYIRPHQGLDGDTPADRSGIKIIGDSGRQSFKMQILKASTLTKNKICSDASLTYQFLMVCMFMTPRIQYQILQVSS